MTDILWINKYKPKKVNELIGNSNQINDIINWLKNFNKIKDNSLIVSGGHGVGKSLGIKLILKKLKLNHLILHSGDVKNKKAIAELIKKYKNQNPIYDIISKTKKRKFVLVIDDTETITLTSEKSSLTDLYKQNEKNRFFPIIFISNIQYSKFITNIKKTCQEIKLSYPSSMELKLLINKICRNEEISIKDDKVIKKLIKFSQNDIRRLINSLQDLKYSHDKKEINLEKINEYIASSQKKNIDITLFDATKNILESFQNINSCIQLYETEKVLLPLMIHENFHKNLIARSYNSNQILNSMKHVTESISRGDVIETNIYTDQNWYLQDIHGFITCAETSYHINKYNKIKKKLYYNLSFSSDLNKTSLKNINKKNIMNMKNSLNNKSIDDILYINKLLHHLASDNEYEKIYDIVKNSNYTSKLVEVSIKIDKSLPKLTLTSKNKKRLTNIFKNNA